MYFQTGDTDLPWGMPLSWDPSKHLAPVRTCSQHCSEGSKTKGSLKPWVAFHATFRDRLTDDAGGSSSPRQGAQSKIWLKTKYVSRKKFTSLQSAGVRVNRLHESCQGLDHNALIREIYPAGREVVNIAINLIMPLWVLSEFAVCRAPCPLQEEPGVTQTLAISRGTDQGPGKGIPFKRPGPLKPCML